MRTKISSKLKMNTKPSRFYPRTIQENEKENHFGTDLDRSEILFER